MNRPQLLKAFARDLLWRTRLSPALKVFLKAFFWIAIARRGRNGGGTVSHETGPCERQLVHTPPGRG
jgi:hypothetical protein